MNHEDLWPRATVDIDAPLDDVWAVMLDAPRYGEWNPFVVRAETPDPPAVGNPIVLHVRWANGRGARSPERISVVDAPTTGDDGVRRACLSYVYEGLPSRLHMVHSVRHQRLSQAPGGPTRYETVGEFTGPFVRLAGPARVTDGFRRHAEALKARCERTGPGVG